MADDGLKAAQSELSDKVLGRPGVSGTAIGMRDGEPCLMVYISSDEGAKGVPKRVRGVPVHVERTGAFRRL